MSLDNMMNGDALARVEDPAPAGEVMTLEQAMKRIEAMEVEHAEARARWDRQQAGDVINAFTSGRVKAGKEYKKVMDDAEAAIRKKTEEIKNIKNEAETKTEKLTAELNAEKEKVRELQDQLKKEKERSSFLQRNVGQLKVAEEKVKGFEAKVEKVFEAMEEAAKKETGKRRQTKVGLLDDLAALEASLQIGNEAAEEPAAKRQKLENNEFLVEETLPNPSESNRAESSSSKGSWSDQVPLHGNLTVGGEMKVEGGDVSIAPKDQAMVTPPAASSPTAPVAVGEQDPLIRAAAPVAPGAQKEQLPMAPIAPTFPKDQAIITPPAASSPTAPMPEQLDDAPKSPIAAPVAPGAQEELPLVAPNAATGQAMVTPPGASPPAPMTVGEQDPKIPAAAPVAPGAQEEQPPADPIAPNAPNAPIAPIAPVAPEDDEASDEEEEEEEEVEEEEERDDRDDEEDDENGGGAASDATRESSDSDANGDDEQDQESDDDDEAAQDAQLDPAFVDAVQAMIRRRNTDPTVIRIYEDSHFGTRGCLWDFNKPQDAIQKVGNVPNKYTVFRSWRRGARSSDEWDGEASNEEWDERSKNLRAEQNKQIALGIIVVKPPPQPKRH